jgi:cytoskeleton protein RodZ
MTDPTQAPPGTQDASADRPADLALSSRELAPPTAVFAVRRAELGMSHEDVANQLKFAPRLIEALEAGEFDKLPGRTFARGMLRSYARLLKIDPAPILAQLDASDAGAHTGPEHAVSLRTPIPFSEGGKHVNLVYTILSFVILVVVAFYAFEWYQEKGGASKLAFVDAGRPAPQAVEQAAEPAVAETAGAPQPEGRDAKPATFASAGPAPVPETAARTEEKKPDDGKSAPLAPGKRRIVIQFEKEAWVEIKGGNGVTLLSQLNPAGSEKVIDGNPPFQLTIGNAPSVHVTYNDQPVDLKPHFKVDVARLTLN